MDNDADGKYCYAGMADLASATPFAGVEYLLPNGGLSRTVAKRVHSDPNDQQKIGQGLAIKLNRNRLSWLLLISRSLIKLFFMCQHST